MPDGAPIDAFDLSLKLLIRRYPHVLLRLAGGESEGPMDAVRTSIIAKELEADDVFLYATPGGREGLHVEYQAESDVRQVRRWLLKVLAFEEELGVPVVLLVVYLRRTDRARGDPAQGGRRRRGAQRDHAPGRAAHRQRHGQGRRGRDGEACR